MRSAAWSKKEGGVWGERGRKGGYSSHIFPVKVHPNPGLPPQPQPPTPANQKQKSEAARLTPRLMSFLLRRVTAITTRNELRAPYSFILLMVQNHKEEGRCWSTGARKESADTDEGKGVW